LLFINKKSFYYIDVSGKIKRLTFFLTQLHLVYDAEIAHNITAHLKCHFFIYVRCVLQ